MSSKDEEIRKRNNTRLKRMMSHLIEGWEWQDQIDSMLQLGSDYETILKGADEETIDLLIQLQRNIGAATVKLGRLTMLATDASKHITGVLKQQAKRENPT